MKYLKHHDGDRVRPVMKGYKLRCCDCGLVHELDFFVVRRGRELGVEFLVRRDNRATAAARRKKVGDS